MGGAVLSNRRLGLREARNMALGSPFLVCIEEIPGKSFGETMNEIRIWLDHRDITSVSFMPRAQANSGIGFEIGFNSEDEACRFELEFRSNDKRGALV